MGDSEKEKPVRKTRTWACIGLSSLLGVVLVIGGILVCILFKDFLDNMIRDQIPLRVGSKITDAWLHPPVKPLMRLYFFNTTNPEGYLKGEKPFLVEMGPYTWEETMEKVGVVWGEDGSTVKYSVKRTYRFRRDLSIGGVDDRVTLPNIPMFGSINQMRWAGKLVQQALSSMLDILKQEVFNSTTVGEIVWGFDHPLIKLGNDVLPPEKKLPFDKFGFFTNRNNSVEGEFEIMTGMDGLHNIGELLSFQGKQKMNMWNSDECDKIRGSDGTLFHPGLERNETLHMYNKALCQSLPLVYQEDVDHHGVNTYRFVPPSNVFGTPKENPKNKCYCKEEPCAPSGLFNVSACQFGSPVMLSWPHFYQADPSLVDAVDGLNPTREKHQFQMDLVPKMGIAMHATARSQINLVMQAQEHVKQLKGVRDIIYPIFWFQTGVDELPEETVNLLQMAVHAPERARGILYPILFAVGALLILAVVAFLVKRLRNTSSKVEKVENGGHQLPGKTTQARTPPPDYNESA